MRFATVGVVVVVLLAGCGGGGGNGTVQLSATPATIGESTLESTGYQPIEESASWVNTTVSVSLTGDVELQASKDVRAQSPIRVYGRDTDAGRVVVALLAVPAVHLLEDSADVVRNPAGAHGPSDLAERVFPTYSNVEVGEQVANRSVTMLGNDTFLTTYAVTAIHEGSTVDRQLSIATVRHAGDFVTFVAIHPASADEPANLQSVLGGVQH